MVLMEISREHGSHIIIKTHHLVTSCFQETGYPCLDVFLFYPTNISVKQQSSRLSSVLNLAKILGYALG